MNESLSVEEQIEQIRSSRQAEIAALIPQLQREFCNKKAKLRQVLSYRLPQAWRVPSLWEKAAAQTLYLGVGANTYVEGSFYLDTRDDGPFLQLLASPKVLKRIRKYVEIRGLAPESLFQVRQRISDILEQLSGSADPDSPKTMEVLRGGTIVLSALDKALMAPWDDIVVQRHGRQAMLELNKRPSLEAELTNLNIPLRTWITDRLRRLPHSS